MVDTFSKAKFWKCALQVNPASYTGYRGNEQSLTEDEYNKKLLEVCLEEGIKRIIGHPTLLIYSLLFTMVK
ncbi:hypothetical protein [Thalassotalea piscium]|uniref:hypothetical protein n=1 Tax=Thalassotalea piscium TaxID=1230533 RepID=UPI002573B527|nr:hypothetical protein [Thalassotalea piscium]